ncbi:MAG: regulatory iron-sulfur-containing complex subunit RicT [Phycisphaerae bacterium]
MAEETHSDGTPQAQPPETNDASAPSGQAPQENSAPTPGDSSPQASQNAPEDGDSAQKPADGDEASPPQDDADGNEGHRSSDNDNDDEGNNGGNPSRPGVVVRYGLMRYVGEFRHNLDTTPRPGSHVVIRTDRGVELGEVIAAVSDETGYGKIPCDRLEEFLQQNGSEYPFRRNGRVLRAANRQDIIDQRHLDSSAKEEAVYCRQQIKEHKLDMKLVSVEHLLGGERIVFYFTSEHRVDFRELVRKLAGQYRTRIEMRQVGARDEARLVADYERCGQRCCCQQFLKDLKPVSMRMAKVQKATLDPSKISGRCGRLMCCLRYEDQTYGELKKKLPRKNTWVRTEELCGKVVDTQIITQLVKVMLQDGTFQAIPNEEIVERDLPEPPPREKPQPRREPRREKAPDKTEKKEAPAQAQPSGDQETEQKPKKKRRRRRKKKPAGDKQGSGQPQSQQDKPQQGGGKPDSQGDQKPKKKRRRRRRKKKPSGGGGGGGGNG